MWVALGDELDAVIDAIAHVSGKRQRSCEIPCAYPEEHALDPATNDEMYSAHICYRVMNNNALAEGVRFELTRDSRP